MSDYAAEQLAKLAIVLPSQPYATKEITNDLAIFNQLKAAGKPRRHYRHWVFSRQGQPCYVCGTAILKQMAGVVVFTIAQAARVRAEINQTRAEGFRASSTIRPILG